MRSSLAVLFLAVCACGSDDTNLGAVDRLELEPAAADVAVELGATVDQPYAVIAVRGTTRTDVTAGCGLTVDPGFGTFAGGVLTVPARGGRATVTATCPDGVATGSLQVTVTGRVIAPGAPADAPAIFAGATATTDAARTPLIEYPIAGAISPRNVPPVEAQWTTAGNDLFHLRLASRFLAVDVYTPSPEAMLPADAWRVITTTAAGDTLDFAVEALAQTAPTVKYVAPPVSITMSNDTIDETAIYWWASSSGAIMSQNFGATTPPTVVKDQCTSCHSMSRNGNRLGYSRCVAGDCGQLFAGFMRFDSATQTWAEPVNANDRAIRGSYTTFAPVGNPFPDDTRALAMVSMSTGTLALYDPDTGAAVASNLDVATHGPGAPRSALMADWSPDGSRVVFASSPTPGQWIDLDDGRIATMSYSFTGGVHTFGEPTFLVPDPITLSSGVYDNFFFPSYSPDGELVVFNAARAAWRDSGDARRPGQRLMLADADGAWVRDLTALNGGHADLDITWAHWAPIVSSEYYWIVFSSERDYGHRATAATSPASCRANGVTQCKQIWMSAIRRDQLANPIDPSAPPMWLPGQDAQANNISPYWSVPPDVE